MALGALPLTLQFGLRVLGLRFAGLGQLYVDLARLHGPPALGNSRWQSWCQTRVLAQSVGIRFKFVCFQWPSEVLDLGVKGFPAVQILIMVEPVTSAPLRVQSAVPRVCSRFS